MNKIAIRAVPKQFDNGSFLLLPATPSDKKLMDSFASAIGDKYVRITLTEIKANKTYDQVRTVWGLIEALYEIENHAKPTARQAALAYAHLINLYAPQADDPLDPMNKIPLTLSQMNKYEASNFINCIMSECMERMGESPDKSLIVDVQDFFTEFIEWRGRQKRDPIDIDENGEWLSEQEWREKNAFSFASGEKNDLELHHILSRGGHEKYRDCTWNWIMLTHYEHIEIVHRHGWERLLDLYPHLIPRVKAAYDKGGELYPYTVKEKFDEAGEADDENSAESTEQIKGDLTTESLAEQALFDTNGNYTGDIF